MNKNKAVPEDYVPKSPPQLPVEGARAIKSTRIRTARNLAGFRKFFIKNVSSMEIIFVFFSAFTDNMTKEQRLEIESTLNKVFDGFTDERLKGRYYSMATMSEEEKKDLVRN